MATNPERTSSGLLQINVINIQNNFPIQNARVTISYKGEPDRTVEQLTTNDPAPRDHLAYLTRTPDGKILKSSTVYIRNSKGKVSAILAINYDISKLLMVESAVHDLISTANPSRRNRRKSSTSMICWRS